MAAPERCARDQPRWERVLVVLVALVLALAWALPLSAARTWGWDESMHVELPAVRMVLAIQAGAFGEAFDVLMGTSQYPCVVPAALGAVQAFTGVSEHACRVVVTCAWCAALVGLHSLAREVVRRVRALESLDVASRRALPWLVMAFAALSPLCLAYAGTLFLEVPFACVLVFLLRAWIRRRVEPYARGREIRAGIWLTIAIFTKFNYGLLIAAALALDWLCDAIAAARKGSLAPFFQRSAWLFAVPLVVATWWFVWPVPRGFDVGAAHREALFEFLSGNRAGARVPSAQRLFHAGAYLAYTPRLLLFELVGACAALTLVLDAPVRCIVLSLACLVVPMWLHPFHLDRFLVPPAIPLAILGGIGAVVLLARCVRAPAWWLVGLLAACCVPMGDREVLTLARATGQLNDDPKIRDYQASIYARWRDLSGARALPTAGLPRDEFAQLTEPVAREVGPEERWGWIGLASEVSPAAVDIALLQHHGSLGGSHGVSRERFRRDADRARDVTYFGADPAWSDAELVRFADDFDVLFFTDPIDLKDRPARRFMRDYARRLTGELGWSARAIATVEISKPLSEPRAVTLFACRKTK